MAEHTKEPWKVEVSERESWVNDSESDEGSIADFWTNGYRTGEEMHANARRAAECVNALAGIDHPERLAELIAGARAVIDNLLADGTSFPKSAFRLQAAIIALAGGWESPTLAALYESKGSP